MDAAADVERVVDASEYVIAEFEERDEVAHAEVGGVVRRHTDAVITGDGVRETGAFDDVGVWWRVFAGGGVDYRFTGSLETEHLDDLLDRSIRSGEMLDHDVPPRYDPETVHRATHPGWGDGTLAARSPEQKAGDVADALEGSLADLKVPLDRVRVEYWDETVEEVLLTTSGSSVHQTVERVAADALLVTPSGAKFRDHTAATAGERFFDALPARLSSLADRARAASRHDAASLDGGEYRLLLGPAAAGELFHQLGHYLELDAAYIGSSPLEPGDEIGPSGLEVEDVVRSGSWTARAYDAEARPSHPVTLVSNGAVANRLADVGGAIAEEGHAPGCLVPSVGYENPPRIHARHLDVASGDAAVSELRAGADLHVERFGDPRFANEATRVKRASTMPPSTLYARSIADATPAEHAAEASEQTVEFPIAEGYTLGGGDRTGLVPDATVAFDLSDLGTIELAGGARRTVTGTCTKHRSRLPYAVTAPPVSLTCRVRVD